MPEQHKFIDMHIHLFTARYLPLHGIFRSFGAINWLARGLARFAVSITGMDDLDSSPRLAFSSNVLRALQGQSADGLMNAIAARSRELLIKYQSSTTENEAEEESARLLLRAIDDLNSGLFPVQHAKRPASSRIMFDAEIRQGSAFDGTGTTPDHLDTILAQGFALAAEALSENDFFDDAAHLHSESHFEKRTYDGLRSAGLTPRDLGIIGQLLVFIGTMVLSEHDRYQALEDDYADGKPSNGVDADKYVGILLDMHHAYVEVFSQDLDPPYFDFKRQIRRMKALAALRGVELISFGSVDPFRGPRKCLENVDYGVEQGVEGFKLYPPLGYRAFESNNYVTAVNPAAQRADKYEDLAENPAPTQHAQDAMNVIIQHFSKCKLRLFAHCNPKGFQVKQGYGIFSDPEHWRQGMEEFDAKDLRLFLAHGGGTMDVDWHGWAAATDEDFEKSFAYRAVRLAQTHRNVYLGLGHILDVFDADNHDVIRQRLVSLLNAPQPVGTSYAISQKLCYGSDWNMPRMIGKTRKYLSAFYRIFDDPKLRPFAQDFFKDNADRFLNS
ncbi:hypothetical protein [Ruegeria atlantica]|uniref:hypothetical protein n=1 Tax=Ruegeria atlantica TaxID=81569 RepID=UPI00249475DA|nr:hypothetical protein [Ruegeria atlantica]